MNSITEEAKAFMIWRAATAVDWDCTAPELARETGIHVVTVNKIVKKRGWRKRLKRKPESNKFFIERSPVDFLMKGYAWARVQE